MANTLKRPSELLLGKKIGSGWKVIQKLPPQNQKYGSYSVCYVVEKDGQEAFLKAVDLKDPLIRIARNVFEEINKITSRANNEKEIAALCTSYRMKNVVQFIEAGEHLEDATETLDLVHFIIYEKALGDGNKIIESFGGNLDNVSIYSRLSLLHNTANALRAMHQEDIVHQDLKSSNIMQFIKYASNYVFKLGDFDCARKKSGLSLNDELREQSDNYAGTYRYAPIELLYGHLDTDWEVVRKGTDFYLLGSLISFYFTGRHITELMKSHLHRSMLWERIENQGNYKQLLPRINDAFELSIEELALNTDYDQSLSETLCLLVKYLSHPDPRKRGRQTHIASPRHQLSLLPVVSKLGHLKNYFKGL